jgi:DNA (cytosine-5)-methyltransferase 1
MKRWHGFAPLVDGLNALGYGTTVQTLDASDFGVPQTRRRLFILCSKGAVPEPVPLPGTVAVKAWEILDYDPITGKDLYKSRELYSVKRAKATLERFERGVATLGKGKPFLLVYYGSDAAGGWQSLDRPLRTLTTLDRFGLVTWKDEVPFLRMLQVPEIMRAMGFRETDKFQFTGTRREQIKQLGNGVCPPVMEAVVRHLCVEEEKPSKAPKRRRAMKQKVPVLA